MRRLLVLVLAVTALVLAAQVGATGPTTATTGDATDITSTTARLHASLSAPGNIVVLYTDGNEDGSVGMIETQHNQDVSAVATGLKPDQKYTYWAEGQTTGGEGAHKTFRTLSANTDLSAEETESQTTAAVGDTITFNVVVLDHGPEVATGVVATITLGAGLDLVSVATDRGTCTSASPIQCTIGELSTTEKTQITVTAKTTAPGALTSTMQVTSTSPDPSTGNNAAGATVTVAAPPPPPPPAPKAITRSVVLTSVTRTLVAGRVVSPAAACNANAAVAVSRKAKNHWIRIAHGPSNTRGGFSFRVRPGSGAVRASVTKLATSSDICSAATSASRVAR